MCSPGLTQGVGKPLVLRQRLLQLALGLQQPLLERPHPLGCIGEAPAQRSDLFFQYRYLCF